ncbi:ras-related protein rapA [Trichogramma pretiosum]|uniref:ras-related protein rapA n=1 Tax=Trichogramma pretiosum TaxID=7493 RepID=UPI0006C96E7D|nr:ras-related protein rapA [Trichogramma pretiosum]
MFVNSGKITSVLDRGVQQFQPVSTGVWFLSSLSFVTRANELLNGHWMDDHLATEKSFTFPQTLVATKNLLELDLDYFERRGADGCEPEITSSASKEEDSPADTLERVKIIFLGANGVGKTSIIRQFVWNEFSEDYRPTERRETYYPSVVLAERMYELKISDLPTIPYFPVSSHLEWTDFRYYGLRSATAYVLVYDLSNQETFQYIKTLRDQIFESRDMRNVPLLVVGNKQDKLPTSSTTGGSSSGGGGGSTSTGTNARHRDIVNLVRKHWRCGYVECSARFNYRVVQVFRELMKSIQLLEGKPAASPTPTQSQSLIMQQAASSSAGTGGGKGSSGGFDDAEASGSDNKCILL